MPKFNVLVPLSLYTHVIANRLNLKYVRCAMMAEWLTHLTKDVGGNPVRVFPDPSYKLSTPWMLIFIWVFFLPTIVKGLRTTRTSQLYCLH